MSAHYLKKKKKKNVFFYLKANFFNCAGGYDRGECLKTVESYDISTNKWTTMQPMKVPRGRFNAAVINNKVYAVGGCDGQKELSSAEYWDPESNSWKQLPNLPAVRSHAGKDIVDDSALIL